ncbi:unnamed protein product [Linum tenue]|uniref:Uncharacterized protein n=1 Tax=Linum tenue TaxID=586396 RepID=A0AAV0GY09_9ROSI|nr:unnamed protein product [Linum tenue]
MCCLIPKLIPFIVVIIFGLYPNYERNLMSMLCLQGNFIEGISHRLFAEALSGCLNIGSVYVILEFAMCDPQASFRACNFHRYLVITPATKLEDVTASSIGFTTKSFQFTEFNSLPAGSYCCPYLTDVVGRLVSISQPEYVEAKGGITTIQKVTIKDHIGTSLCIWMWGSFSLILDARTLVDRDPNDSVVLAFGGLIMTQLRGVVNRSSTSGTRVVVNLLIHEADALKLR